MDNDQALEGRFKNLRVWNIVVGLILAAQAVVVAVLTNNFSLPVTSTFMTGAPGTAQNCKIFSASQQDGVSSPSLRYQLSLS